MTADRRAAASRGRAATATRLLAHRIIHRACRRGELPDLAAAVRLADERLVPSAAARRAVAAEALQLAVTVLGERRPGGALEGALHANARVGLRRRDGSARVVLIPTLFLPAGTGAPRVIAVQDSDSETAKRRARRYRHAARILLGRPVRAFVVRAGGALEELAPGPPSRSGPRGAAYRDRECSPFGRPQSGRRPR